MEVPALLICCLAMISLLTLMNIWLKKSWIFLAESLLCLVMALISATKHIGILWTLGNIAVLIFSVISAVYVYRKKKILFLFQEISYLLACALFLLHCYFSRAYPLGLTCLGSLSLVSLSQKQQQTPSSVFSVLYGIGSAILLGITLVLQEAGFAVIGFFFVGFSIELSHRLEPLSGIGDTP